MDDLTSMVLRICTFGLLIIGITGIENTGCQERSLIGQNHLNISDSSYTASSFYNYRYQPNQAKLYGKYGWGPRDSNNPNDYLQIDLGTERVITAVATQGNGGDKDDPQHRVKYEWVTRYKLYLTNDISTWNNNHQSNKYESFQGNSDSTTIVRQDLKNPTPARYIRFVPVDYEGYKTMRVDIYFYEEQLLVTATPGKTSVYLNWTFTQCSYKNYEYVVEIDNSTSKLTSDQPRYNLTNLRPYTKYSVSVKVITQQGYEVWRKTLKIKTTMAEPEASPTLTSIKASSSETIVVKWQNPCEKKPCPNYTVCIVHYNRRDYVCQCEDRYFGDQCQFECFGGQALGMENRKIPDSAITASSAWAGKDHGYHARLNNNPQHWAPSINIPGEWLQVDFGKTTVVTKIATQGRPFLPAFYTTSYSLTYRRENESWKTYVHASHGETLPGNTNHDGTVTNTLVPMIVTRYIRVYPKTWNHVVVMRVEFYGCYYPQ